MNSIKSKLLELGFAADSYDNYVYTFDIERGECRIVVDIKKKLNNIQILIDGMHFEHSPLTYEYLMASYDKKIFRDFEKFVSILYGDDVVDPSQYESGTILYALNVQDDIVLKFLADFDQLQCTTKALAEDLMEFHSH